jgi:hypothetical protein
MRKDKFFQETGYSTEYVTTLLREEKGRKEKEEYEKAINKAKELEQAANASTASVPSADKEEKKTLNLE